MAKPKTEIDRRLDRIERAISTMGWWLVDAQTGFGTKDAELIDRILQYERINTMGVEGTENMGASESDKGEEQRRNEEAQRQRGEEQRRDGGEEERRQQDEQRRRESEHHQRRAEAAQTPNEVGSGPDEYQPSDGSNEGEVVEENTTTTETTETTESQ